MSLGQAIAMNVRAARARHGWTQAALADMVGVSRTALSGVENAARAVKVDELPKLCAALGISFHELIKGADPDEVARLML
jgi:transcriptional regulator with XRE-family HTH domain